MNKIRVIVCEDIKGIRKHIVSALNADEEIEVVGEAESGKECIELTRRVETDIILMDIQMEYETAGIDAIREICEEKPGVKIIVLTAYDKNELILEAYYTGASDYIIKSADAVDICKNIKRVYETQDFVGPLIAKNLRAEFVRMKKSEKTLMFFIHKFSTLTQTEKEILKLLYQGYTKKQISQMRFIEVSTIKVHVKHILKKLSFPTISNLVSFLRKIKIYENFNL